MSSDFFGSRGVVVSAFKLWLSRCTKEAAKLGVKLSSRAKRIWEGDYQRVEMFVVNCAIWTAMQMRLPSPINLAFWKRANSHNHDADRWIYANRFPVPKETSF